MIHGLKKYESLTSVIDRCNDRVLEILAESSIREAKIASESFKNGGKRLRPALMVLSYMAPKNIALEQVPSSIIHLAAAVELIHLATLFHDDVIDEVETRRTQVSARAKYGNYASVLAGDFVLAEALLLVQRSGFDHTLPEFLKTIRVLVRGESQETIHKFDFDLSETLYNEIISEKSASLFELSCKAGGMSVHSEHTEVLGRFGWSLGMAFQMIDDLDDMLDLPHGMDCDLKNGYFALPVIQALNSLQDGHRDGLIETIRSGDFTEESERNIVNICIEHGGIQHAHDEIYRHLDRAGERLASFETGEAQRLLSMIVEDLKAYTDRQVAGFERFAQARTTQAG